jgi:hypothetical protein
VIKLKFFKKIQDERLLIKQLKSIRIAFWFENLCIIGLLIYYGIKNGFVNVSQNPLWIIWVLTSVLFLYLQMPISIDMESDKINKKKQEPYYVKIFYSIAIGIIVGLIMVLSGSQIRDSLITGIVIFICFIIPSSIIHYLRKKQSQDLDD